MKKNVGEISPADRRFPRQTKHLMDKLKNYQPTNPCCVYLGCHTPYTPLATPLIIDSQYRKVPTTV